MFLKRPPGYTCLQSDYFRRHSTQWVWSLESLEGAIMKFVHRSVCQRWHMQLCMDYILMNFTWLQHSYWCFKWTASIDFSKVIFSCDQAALWMVFSDRLSVRLSHIFTPGQFWPSGIVVACVCLCVRPSGNHLLVRTITQHPFKLGSPNLHHRCKRPWLRSLLFWGVIDLDLQGEI